jgi:squalene-hopene/tetraprenyl-beta-curcumene cyclase
MHLKDATFKCGESQKLIATLTDENGNPLNNKVVYFYVNTSMGWNYLGSNTTDGTGTAEYTIKVTMPNGTYLFKAVFNGDSEYAPSEDTAQITVVGDVAFIPILLAVGKAIAWAVGEHLFMKYVAEPYACPFVADVMKKSPLPPFIKEYLDEPKDVCNAIEFVLTVKDITNILKNGYKAALQFDAAREATDKAVGGHMRWFWHYAKNFIYEFTKLAAGKIIEYIDNKVYEEKGVHLTEEEKSQINQTIFSPIREPNEAFLQKMGFSTFLDSFIVDPIVGYTEPIKVPENVKRMRIYLGWNVSEYTENSFILKDPAGNTITPQLNVMHPSDPEATKVAVELTVWNPPAGNWILWFNGSKLPNENVVMSAQFDKVFEIIPQYVPVNPGHTANITLIFNNFGDKTLMASLSPKDVPPGWNIAIPPYCPTIFPGNSSAMTVSVTSPPDIRYGASQTLSIEAAIDGSTYTESFTVFIYPYIEVEDGIAYLHEVQLSDGSWRDNVGITALALLAYLNAGYDESVEDVRKGIGYILAHVHDDGSIYGTLPTYETSLAILALVATHNRTYNKVIENAKNWLLNTQWDESSLWGSVDKDNWYYGGFGYGWGSRPDLSNTQFAVMALDAAGVPKNDPMWAKLQVFLARTQNRQEDVYIPELNYTVKWNPAYNAYNDGGFVYHPGASLAGNMKSYGSMTGAGIWGLKLSGVPNDDPRMKAALDWVRNHYTWDENPGMGTAGLYYYYLSMSKALVLSVGVDGEIDGHRWYDDLAKKLIGLQHPEGYWVNPDSSFWEGIPELTTAYAVLSLEYRIKPPEVERPSWLTFILRSNADLHIYDPMGRHVGRNYETGELEVEIPNATYEHNGYQKITLPYLETGTYRIVLVGIGTGEYNLTAITGTGDQVYKRETYIRTIRKGEVHEARAEIATIIGITVEIEEPRPSKYIVQTATNTGNASFISDAGTIENLTAVNESKLPAEGKPALSFPHGFFSFNITGLAVGQTVNVTIVLPSNIPVNAQYWKYQTHKGWYQIPIRSNDGDNIIIIQLTDGGEGDDDGIANGVIVDAGGPGIPIQVPKPSAAVVPTLPKSLSIVMGSPLFDAYGVDRHLVELYFPSARFEPYPKYADFYPYIIVGGPFVNPSSAVIAEKSGIKFGRDYMDVNGTVYRSEWGHSDYAIVLIKGWAIYVMGTHRYGTEAALLWLSRKPSFYSYAIIKWVDINGDKDVDWEEVSEVVRI